MTVFDDIYRANAWNGVESLSGPGSGNAATRKVREEIMGLVAELGVESVLDVGCGDGFWMPALPGYVGIDASHEAIAQARDHHPDRIYVVADGTGVGADFDLVICRDAIQHLSLAEGVALVRNLTRHCRWLLASTYVDSVNVDIPTGHFYSPDLEAEPFGLGPPDRYVFDGYGYSDPDEVRDPAKFLGLWTVDRGQRPAR